GSGVLGDEAGVELDPPDVVVAVVVVPQGAGQVAGAAVGLQVAGGGPDGLVGVVDVALAVAGPGRGQELHRPLGAGGAGPPDAAHAGLDQVDRGQDRPRDPELPLGRVVVGQEVVGRGRGDDAPGRHVRGRVGQRPQLAAGGDVAG